MPSQIGLQDTGADPRYSRQWLTAGFLMAFVGAPGQTVFIAQFNTSLSEAFGLGTGALGLIFGIATIISATLLLLTGGIADRYPPRSLVPIVLFGLSACATLIGFQDNIVLLLFSLIGLRFLGQGMMMHIASTAMARWFDAARGKALAYAGMGAAAAEACFPFVVTTGIGAFGWRTTWIMAAAMTLLCIVMMHFLLRITPGYASSGMQTDENAGLAASNLRDWRKRNVLLDPIFLLAFPVLIGPAAIGSVFVFHQASLVQAKGWDLHHFLVLFPLLPTSTTVGMFLAGRLIDRFGAWRLRPLVLIPQAVGCAFITAVHGEWVMIPIFVAFGLGNGLAITTASALWAEVYGTRNLGRIRALASFAIIMTTAVTPALSGVLLEQNLSFDLQAQFAGLAVLTGSILPLLSWKLFQQRVHEIRKTSGYLGP